MPTSFRVSLPEPLRAWVEQQASRRGFGTPAEYLHDLIRHDQLRAARDRVDEELLKAIDGGEATEMTEQDWQDVRDEGGRHAARQRQWS